MSISFLLCEATPIILLLSSLTLMGIRMFKPSFSKRSLWLSATSASLIAWVFAILSRIYIPITISIPFFHHSVPQNQLSAQVWQISDSANISNGFILAVADDVYWALSLAITTVLLSSNITRLARTKINQDSEQDSQLSNHLIITAISLFAMLAGNIFTLILAWVILDSLILLIRISQSGKDNHPKSTAILFSLGYLGTIVLIFSELITQPSEIPFTLENLPPTQSTLVFIACAFRCGILFWQPILRQESKQAIQRSIILGLTPIAATLMPMIRIASNHVNEVNMQIEPFLFILAASAALTSSIAWLTASDEITGSSFWITGISSFVFIASLRAETNACLSWSLVLICSGGLIFFYSARNRWLNLIIFLAVITISSFPYSPTWQTNLIYQDPIQLINLILVLSQTFLILGYIKHGLRKTYLLDRSERWLTFVYPWGLLILPIIQFTIAWHYQSNPNPTLLESLPGMLSALLALLFFLVKPILNFFHHKVVSSAAEILSLNWLWNLLEKIFYVAQKFYVIIIRWSETTASTLWAFIILALLISLFVQTGILPGD